MVWTTEDETRLQELLNKAHAHNLFPAQNHEDDSFTMVSQDDASMLDGFLAEQALQAYLQPQPKAMAAYGRPKAKAAPYRVNPETAALVTVPDDIPDYDTWRRTVIEFGKYGGLDMTYEMLAMDPSARAKGYCKWVTDRRDSATGLLKDLCDFLIEFQRRNSNDGDGSQLPCIPGTNRVRRIADP